MKDKGLISPPKWLPDNMVLEVLMGSVAYGVSSDASDMDVYGFCIPPKRIVFPHTAGVIHGFDKNVEKFDSWQEHHRINPDDGTEYDFSIHSIIKGFRLLMDNNPNMIDAIFVPRRCVLHSTQVGEHMIEHRKKFLHAGSYHKFKGYAYSQLSKIETKNPKPGSKRAKLIEEFGYDTKFAYHLIRLMNEAEQILVEGDLDITRGREQLKSIRRGEWTLERLKGYFEEKEISLQEMYNKTELPYKPDEDEIKKILVECLEMHYGSLAKAELEQPNLYRDLLVQIHELSDTYTTDARFQVENQ